MQQKIIEQLKKDGDIFGGETKKMRLLQTHISWVFLTGKYAYKIKKAVRIGHVLDFSTLARRKKFCLREVELNRILCGKMYVGMQKIVFDHHRYRLADLNEGGEALEYAVKMVQVPQSRRLDILVKNGKISKRQIEMVASRLAEFHNMTPTSNAMKQNGRPEVYQKKIREDLGNLKKFHCPERNLEQRLVGFIKNNKALFLRRMNQGRIRDIHGDLYLKNIFFVRGRLYFYDRLEFNDSLSHADVAEDVCFAAMDLDYFGRKDLRNHLIEKYIKETSDTDIQMLIFFMMCHKACIRTMVSFFKAEGETSRQRAKSKRQAQRLLSLAYSYLEKF